MRMPCHKDEWLSSTLHCTKQILQRSLPFYLSLSVLFLLFVHSIWSLFSLLPSFQCSPPYLEHFNVHCTHTFVCSDERWSLGFLSASVFQFQCMWFVNTHEGTGATPIWFSSYEKAFNFRCSTCICVLAVMIAILPKRFFFGMVLHVLCSVFDGFFNFICFPFILV